MVVGASGAAVFAAPGLATAPALSIMGFKAGGIHAGMYKVENEHIDS